MIELKKIEKDLNPVWILILIIWVFLMFFSIYELFSKSFINNEIDSLKNISSIGGIFNIVSSLTGVATIWLLIKTIIFQKEELKIQKDSLEREEKINRTIKMVDEWESLSDDDEKHNFIGKLVLLDSNGYSNSIDFYTLCRVIKYDKSVNSFYSRYSIATAFGAIEDDFDEENPYSRPISLYTSYKIS